MDLYPLKKICILKMQIYNNEKYIFAKATCIYIKEATWIYIHKEQEEKSVKSCPLLHFLDNLAETQSKSC